MTLNSFVIWIFGHVALQCPNKKDIVIKANNDVEIGGEDADDVCVEYPVE